MYKLRKFCIITLLLLLICTAACAGLLFTGCAASSLEDKAKADYSYLQKFDYGKIRRKTASASFDTVEALKEADLAEGAVAVTKGYYSAGDKGGASYVIEKEEKSGGVEISNGLFANIVPDEDSGLYVLNVKQFGARADGETADQGSINAAIAYAASSLYGKASVVYLPAGEYRVDNEIQANDLKNAIITGAGDDTVIFTDNGYRSWWEFFFACWRDENTVFANFRIEARESWGQNKYFRQITLIDCDDCYLFNLTLNIPETAWDGKPFVRVDAQGNVVETASIDKQYSNLTLYSGDKNITVDSCTMYQMSGTYRGANIGIMDFYERTTQNITIKNCVLHDNARDEQVGIFTKSGAEDSHVIGVNFLNNKVYTHPTPYRDLIGGRTMCFTVAYDNAINDINIEGNEFVSYADSKFMTFGSAKNCTVKNNKITVIANNGNAGYVFDSACAADGDVVISGNELYLTYANSSAAGKCVSAGHLTFKNNTVVADCTVTKIADRLGVYEGNDFTFFGPFGSCGAAFVFNYNTVTSYAEHLNAYNEIFFNYSYDKYIPDEVMAETSLQFIGNTVTDYTFYNGAKNQKVFDKLSVINEVPAKELVIKNNVYNCPNYSYKSADDYMWICWVRGTNRPAKIICEGNDLQGAKTVYGVEGWDGENDGNTFRSFGTYREEEPEPVEISILYKGETAEEVDAPETEIELTSSEDGVVWIAYGASVKNGVVRGSAGTSATVFAVKADGSGAFAKITVNFPSHVVNWSAIAFIILAVAVLLGGGAAAALIIFTRGLKENEQPTGGDK